MSGDQDTTSRRTFLTGAAAALAAVTAARADAQTKTSSRGRTVTPKPITSRDASLDWTDPITRLVRRITLGLDPVEVARAKQLGYSGYLEYHLQWDRIDDTSTDQAVAARMPLLSLPLTQLATADATELANQLSDAAMYRGAFSNRQLLQRMVEFWTDHFTISINKVGYLKAADDRDVIRANALTTFPQLLRATAHSGAMLSYLDQSRSRTPTPNQNYAREIMELHTLGVDGGYTQEDVAELSRILTGWSTSGAGTFAFNRSFHDRNAKTFMGRAFPAMASTASDAAMKGEGDTAIDMLLTHPSTARYVSWKMARWLLAYDPPEAVVTAAAATYASTGGDIKAMIRTILARENLVASPAKYKRPWHLAVSSFRALAPTTLNIRPARQRADQMGMPMYYWEQPNGYPDRIDWWSGLVVQRWSWASYIATQTSATNVNTTLTEFKSQGNTPEGVVAVIATRFYGSEMPVTLRDQLLTYAKAGTFNDARIREVLALGLSAHQFQWY